MDQIRIIFERFTFIIYNYTLKTLLNESPKECGFYSIISFTVLYSFYNIYERMFAISIVR